MDWNSLLRSVGPTLISILDSTVASFGTTKPPPATPPATVPPGTVPHPSNAIKGLQSLLNTVLTLDPPLTVDGWLGPKTEAAIEAGIVKLRSFGIG